MNRSGKIIILIAIIAAFILGLLNWSRSTKDEKSIDGHPPTKHSLDTEQTAEKNSVIKTNKRRKREGPRKPPIPFHSTDRPTLPSAKPKNPSANPVDNTESKGQKATLERKREAYFERFDDLENPTVEEMTMLGEMAFEANEAASAYDHYLEVIDNHSDHFTAPYALYKLAWAEFNFGDVAAAISDMQLMLEWIEDSDSIADKQLREMGTTDLAHFMKKTD